MRLLLFGWNKLWLSFSILVNSYFFHYFLSFSVKLVLHTKHCRNFIHHLIERRLVLRVWLLPFETLHKVVLLPQVLLQILDCFLVRMLGFQSIDLVVILLDFELKVFHALLETLQSKFLCWDVGVVHLWYDYGLLGSASNYRRVDLWGLVLNINFELFILQFVLLDYFYLIFLFDTLTLDKKLIFDSWYLD